MVDLTVIAAMQNIYISLPYNVAATTVGIDKNEEIASLSTYL